MGLLSNIANGDNFDTKVILREKTSNGFKNRLDKAAEIEDPDTGEKQLKLKSDGRIIPKPDNAQFETLWYKNFIDKLTMDKSHCDFMEIYLTDSEDGDFVEFNEDESELEMSGNESQFQTHRDLENEKTLDLFSEESNEKWMWLAGLGTLIIIDIAGQYIVNQGLQQGVASGVKQGFEAVQGGKGAISGNWVLFTFAGTQLITHVKAKISNLKPW